MMKKFFTALSVLCFSCLSAQYSTLYNPFEPISDLSLNGLEQLDSNLGQYRIFFTGENHNFKSENSNIQLKMIKYLSKKAGVKNYIIELGFSRGYMLNAYINGDTSYYAMLKPTTSNHFLAFYKALKELNEKLPDSAKLKVHGVDIDRFPDDGPILLSSLIDKNAEIPEELSFDIEVLRSYAYYTSVKYKNYKYYESENSTSIIYNNFYSYGFDNAETIDSIIASYTLKKPYYMALLKDKFPLFDQVFSTVIEYRKWMKYTQMPHQNIYRERKMYENLSRLMTDNPKEKYYGQFGRCHTSKTYVNNDCNWYDMKPLSQRLNEGVAKDRIMTIGIFYTNDDYNTYEDTATDRVLKRLQPKEMKTANYLVTPGANDTLLTKHFNYVIFNRPGTQSKSKGYKVTSTYSYDDYHEWAVMFDFGYGQSFFNLDRLNKDLQFGTSKFKQPLQMVSLGYTYSDFGNYNVGKYEQLLSQKVENKGLTYTLSGYSIQEAYGYSPHISKHFTMGFYGILAAQRFSLLIENDSFAYTPTPGFSSIKRYKYINNSFSAGVGIDMRLAFTSYIGIFARGRYLADLSKKYWKNTMSSYAVLDGNSPLTSLSNYSLQVGISILIQE